MRRDKLWWQGLEKWERAELCDLERDFRYYVYKETAARRRELIAKADAARKEKETP